MPDYLKASSTKEVPVPKLLLDQIVGQDRSVELIRKAAVQRRNVLLVGLPGTGKSMLAKAMSEIMPVQRLVDVLIYPNEEDSNNPFVKTVKAGDGKRIMEQSRLEARAQDDNLRLIGLILPMGWFMLTYVLWTLKLMPDVVYAATLILGGVLMIGFALGAQVRVKTGTVMPPKLLVNNSGKKIAPFFEATGARAGALLGDVRHDPLQSLCPVNKLTTISGGVEKNITFENLWKDISSKHPELVEKHEKGYEAIVFPSSMAVYTYGSKDGKIVRTRIYSMNRRSYDAEVVDIACGAAKISLTPEHSVYTSKGDVNAGKVSASSKIIKLYESEIAKAVLK